MFARCHLKREILLIGVFLDQELAIDLEPYLGFVTNHASIM